MMFKHFKTLTDDEARNWLVVNDKEAAEFWRDQPQEVLIEAVGENLRDFGDFDGLTYENTTTEEA